MRDISADVQRKTLRELQYTDLAVLLSELQVSAQLKLTDKKDYTIMDINDSETFTVSAVNAKAAENRRSRFSFRNVFNFTGSSRSRASRKPISAQAEMSFEEMEKYVQDLINSEAQEFTGNDWTRSVSVMLECQICLTNQPLNKFYTMATCSHRFCTPCLETFLKTEISEGRVEIHCPGCPEELDPSDIRRILSRNSQLMEKYEDFMLRRMLISYPGVRWCPAPDCSYAVIATGCESCPKLKCERPGCDTYFCFNCKDYCHQHDTFDAESIMTSPPISSSNDAQMEDIRPCPKCGSSIEKLQDGSCNHMVCPVCAVEFCWLCMKPITANMLHYVGPSGCSFWGQKPMTKKKKVIRDLATLFAAPVAVPVMTALAVPAIIVGLPVWVGRKLHSKYQFKPAPKRKLDIVAGVAASVLTAPVVAGAAVGIGVPASLAYIYGTTTKALISGSLGVKTISKK